MLKILLKTEKNIKAFRVSPYELVAHIYPDLMSEVNYKRWAKYIYKISKDYIKPDAMILELASGNCSLASALKTKYKNVICSDISFQMLKQGRFDKKIVCSMLQLPFNIKFDFIFSSFDSINYITSQDKLLVLFNHVFQYLNENGIFSFDVSLETNSYNHQNDSKLKGRMGQYKYSRKSVYNEKTRIHKNIFYLTDKNGNLFTEVHRQKIYDFNTYFNLLDKAGFYVLHCYHAFSTKDARADMDRVQFIVKRK
ncbi:MAG: class I SAM-dependent methyltransferase [Ignavibacteriaceae bacterium]